MPIYLTRAGIYVGTQAEAGKGFETIDLPRTPAIIAALNAAHTRGAEAARAFTAPQAEPDTSDIPEAGEEFFERAELRMPERREQEPADYQHLSAGNILRRMDAQLASNRGADAIVTYIGTAPPEEVGLFAAAVAMRLKGAGVEPLPKGAILGDPQDGEA